MNIKDMIRKIKQEKQQERESLENPQKIFEQQQKRNLNIQSLHDSKIVSSAPTNLIPNRLFLIDDFLTENEEKRLIENVNVG